MSYSRRDLIVAGAALASTSLVAPSARADIVSRDFDYRLGDTELEGFLAYDPAVTGKRPGILVMHTRRGLGDFIKERTEELAKLGYVAFAADIFGKGVRPVADKDASVQSVKYRKDRALTRARAQAGLDVLAANPQVDAARIGVI